MKILKPILQCYWAGNNIKPTTGDTEKTILQKLTKRGKKIKTLKRWKLLDIQWKVELDELNYRQNSIKAVNWNPKPNKRVKSAIEQLEPNWFWGDNKQEDKRREIDQVRKILGHRTRTETMNFIDSKKKKKIERGKWKVESGIFGVKSSESWGVLAEWRLQSRSLFPVFFQLIWYNDYFS